MNAGTIPSALAGDNAVVNLSPNKDCIPPFADYYGHSISNLHWMNRYLASCDQQLTYIQGREIPVDIFAYTDGENMRPQPFRARFIPRNQQIRKTMEREATEARERLRKWDGETKLNVNDFFRS